MPFDTPLKLPRQPDKIKTCPTNGSVLTASRWLMYFNELLLKVATTDKRVQAAIFLAVVLPVIVIATFAYNTTYHDLTAFTLSRRQSIAHLAATALEQRLDRLSDIGTSLATRVRFRQLVSEGKWNDAISILSEVPARFSSIERVFLTDVSGNLMADTPAIPGVRGKNFAFRDWYQGVSAKWKPYISQVYQRTAEPRYNVIAVALPIKAESGTPAGILVLQVRLDALVEWSNQIDVGPSGFVYFVDKNGHVANPLHRGSLGEVLDYSNLPVAQKVLRGQSGVEIISNPIEKEKTVAAYAPVLSIGWGVIAQEPTRTAFQPRNENLARLIILYGLVFLISCALAYIILRNMSGLKHAKEKIQSLNTNLERRAAELESANKELESFSYSVSHDLRAPLRSIDGFSQALLEDYGNKLDAEGESNLRRVRAATQHMAQLIDDMLDLSRVTRAEIKREKVDLSAVAQSICAELRKTEPQRQVKFTVTEGLTTDADPRLIRIVLENLLRNAWKFTGKHATATIEFGIAPTQASSAYFVRDDGAGFDMAYANKLFGAFQRLHAISEFTGTGIGLATVQRIISRHGGRIWAEGKVEQGATFYFAL